jgi:hypothetical protein
MTVTRSLARGVLIALGCLLLLVAIVIGIRNGWIDLQGGAIQRVRELQAPADERNRQIEDLANP